MCYFSAFMGNELGEAVTNLPRTASRFTGFVTCLAQVHFQYLRKKDIHSLMIQKKHSHS